MKRIGCFTGRIYEEADLDSIKECCLCVQEDDPILQDECALTKTRLRLKAKCLLCHGFEKAREAVM